MTVYKEFLKKKKMIPFYKHNLNKNKNYLKKTLSSSYLTSGPVCEKVENLLSSKIQKIFNTN